MIKQPLYYLASPYTAKNKRMKHKRAQKAIKAAVTLLKKDIQVFSPIGYNAGWERFNLPSEWSFWEKFDLLFLSKCEGLIVLKLKGWERSVGVAAEVAYAHLNNIPVYYINMKELSKKGLKKRLGIKKAKIAPKIAPKETK